MQIRKYQETDLPEMIAIWNEVVEDGIAFPQEECTAFIRAAGFRSAWNNPRRIPYERWAL